MEFRAKAVDKRFQKGGLGKHRHFNLIIYVKLSSLPTTTLEQISVSKIKKKKDQDLKSNDSLST